jgi:hypothetical protein
MSRSDDKSSKRAAVQVAASTIRTELQFMVRRLALPIAAHETSVKAQLNKVARITGIPPRRLKDFRNGYLNKIPAHEDHTIRAAYQKWLAGAKERARAELQQIEAENERLSSVVAGYVSASWTRACAAGAEDRAVSGKKASTANDD